MDLDEALRRRLEENLNGSGWGVLQFHPDPSAVRFWLYSINLVSGPRAGSQASAEFFRDMQAGTGLFKTIDEAKHLPNELLGSVILAWDEATDEVERKGLLQPLVVSLGAFARSTQTWHHMPSLNDVDGLHFAVVDWKDKHNTLIMRPFLLIGKKVPPIEDFIACMAAQLALHLSHFPDGLPKELL
jgi:hypothetical protein